MAIDQKLGVVVVHEVVGETIISGAASRAGVSEPQVDVGGIDTGQVGAAGRLVGLGVEREAVHVDTVTRSAAVSLARLHEVEPVTLTLVEAIVAVQLDQGVGNGVAGAVKSQTVVGVLVDGDVLVGLHPSVTVVSGESRQRARDIAHSQAVGNHNGGHGGGGSNVTRVVQVVGHSRQAALQVEGTIAAQSSRGNRDTGTIIGGVGGGRVGAVGNAIDNVGEAIKTNDTSTSSGVDGNVGVSGGGHSQTAESQVGGGIIESTRPVGGTGVGKELVARCELTGLHHPHKLLGGVVEAKLDLTGGGSHGLFTSELNLLDQVLVTNLSETTTLLGIEVHVVDKKGSVAQRERHVVDEVASHTGKLGSSAELDVKADLMVLQSNEGQSKTVVAAEPEVQGHEQGLGALAVAVGVSRRQVAQSSGVTDHVGVSTVVLLVARQLVPGVHPGTVLLVDLRTTDLELDALDHGVTNTTGPSELGVAVRAGRGLDVGQHRAQVHLGSEITVTLHDDRRTAVEVGDTSERVIHGLNREVGVATVHHLEESDLGIASQVHILRTVGNELHQSTSHGLCIPMLEKLKELLPIPVTTSKTCVQTTKWPQHKCCRYYAAGRSKRMRR